MRRRCAQVGKPAIWPLTWSCGNGVSMRRRVSLLPFLAGYTEKVQNKVAQSTELG